MDVGFETIGNATLICHDGAPVLVTDPWVSGSAYFGSWKLSHEVPAEQLDALRRAQFVWFSHGHPDHLNGDSLPLLRDKMILLPDHRGRRLHDDLVAQGYRVRVLPDHLWTELSPRIRVLSIADYNQDAILLVDVNGRLIVNLNDATDRGWGHFVRRTISRYRRSFLMALHGYGDADMLNYFDESGQRLPLPARVPLGQTIAAQCELYRATDFVPFSSMHRYQRSDSAWASPMAATVDDYRRGFHAPGRQLLPPFIRVHCATDEIERIDPPATSDVLLPPAQFGDHWDEPLEPSDVAAVGRYFRRVEQLDQTLDFIAVRVGGQEHRLRFGRRPRRGTAERGVTFEAPRRSLMTALQFEIFDDLLIGNFMKVTLHGAWGPRGLQPEFSPYVAKYGDNGRARSRRELDRYFADYRRRDRIGHARHAVETRLLTPLRAASSEMIRGTFGPDSRLYRVAKTSYARLRRTL